MEASVRAGTVEILDRERLAARLGVPMSGIAAFCDRWGVEELALFGSVLRDDFGPDSDIDFLVRFKPGRTPGLFVAAQIRRELADMCRRRVDLVHRPTIERSRNYIRREKILESARVVYATCGIRIPVGHGSRRQKGRVVHGGHVVRGGIIVHG